MTSTTTQSACAPTAEAAPMPCVRGIALDINAPDFFDDPEFMDWLNNSTALTWHDRSKDVAGEFSDVVVLVDPGLSGEGSDSDMPERFWDRIVATCRANCAPSNGPHITVRLTNFPE